MILLYCKMNICFELWQFENAWSPWTWWKMLICMLITFCKLCQAEYILYYISEPITNKLDKLLPLRIFRAMITSNLTDSQSHQHFMFIEISNLLRKSFIRTELSSGCFVEINMVAAIQSNHACIIPPQFHSAFKKAISCYASVRFLWNSDCWFRCAYDRN